MKFEDIRKTVNDAWEFSWPPILACIGLTLIFQYFYPETKNILNNIFIAIQQNGEIIEKFRVALEPYGLSTTIPVASLVIVVAVLYIINNVVLRWFANMPPTLSYQQDVLMKNRVSIDDKVLLLRNYPTAENFGNAYYLAVEEYLGSSQALTRSLPYYRAHTFIKFFFIIGLFACIIAFKAGIPVNDIFFKWLLFAFGLIFLWLLVFFWLLFETEQEIMAGWNKIRLGLLDEFEDKKDVSLEPTDDEKIFLEVTSDVIERWWQVRLLDTYKFMWVKRTFFPSAKRRSG